MKTEIINEQAQHAEFFFAPFNGVLDLVADRVSADMGIEPAAVKALLRLSAMTAESFSISIKPRDFLAEFCVKYVAECVTGGN